MTRESSPLDAAPDRFATLLSCSDVLCLDTGGDQWTHGCERTRKKRLSSNEISTKPTKGA